MLKKSLIGLVVIVLIGCGYFGYSSYKDYKRKEYARLVKERNESFARILKENREKEIKRQKKEEERKERIAQGLGKIENIVTYYDSGEKEEEYTLLEGKKDGKYIRWYKSGRICIESMYKDGFLVGETINYFDNHDHTVEAISKYDRTDTNRSFGEHNTQWYKNGVKKQESYKNNDRPKKEYTKYWREDGTLRIKTYFNFDLGLRVSISYYSSGQIKSKFFWDKLKRQQYKGNYWYESGQKYFEANYRKNLIQGVVSFWYESGQKYAEVEFDDFGHANGWCQQWNEDGKIIRKAFLKDGVEQRKPETIRNDYQTKCQDIKPLTGFSKINL